MISFRLEFNFSKTIYNSIEFLRRDSFFKETSLGVFRLGFYWLHMDVQPLLPVAIRFSLGSVTLNKSFTFLSVCETQTLSCCQMGVRL